MSSAPAAGISGVGAFYPEDVRTNGAWPEGFGQRKAESGDRTFNDIPRALDAAQKVTDRYLQAEQADPFLGAKERRVARPELSSAEAEARAAAIALEDAGLKPSQIDTVISYSVTPDRMTPASAGSVAERLGIAGALCFGMDTACATALTQLHCAVGLVSSGRAEHVLLTQSHLLLRAFPMLHPAAPGLGDAATAFIVSRGGRWPVLGTHAVTHGEFHDAVTWVRGDSDEDEGPWWQAGSSFRVGSLDRDGAKALQRDTVSFAAQTLRETVEKSSLEFKDVRLLVSVEPRGWVPGAALEVLGLDPELAESVYETRGHLGAAGPIANLAKAHEGGRTGAGGLALMYAQGAGFTRAGAVIRMDV